jgi:hypothetical protein
MRAGWLGGNYSHVRVTGMHDDDRREAEHINDILARWHAWCAGNLVGTGYPVVNAASRLYRPSRQYDDQNGALDAGVDSVLMAGVNHIIEQITQPYRTALSVQARNLQVKRALWNSPRLPTCELARARLLVESRRMLRDALAKADLL